MFPCNVVKAVSDFVHQKTEKIRLVEEFETVPDSLMDIRKAVVDKLGPNLTLIFRQRIQVIVDN